MNILECWNGDVLYKWTQENGQEVIITHDGQRFVFKSVTNAKIWASGFEKAWSLAKHQKAVHS